MEARRTARALSRRTRKQDPRLFFPFPQSRSQNQKSDDEKRRIAERRVIRERECEASRLYRWLVHQISMECERIQEESENGEGADVADINTRAYENVKNTWTKRGIWNEVYCLRIPGPLNLFQQGSPTDIDIAGLESGNAEGPPPTMLRQIHLPTVRVNRFFELLQRGMHCHQAREWQLTIASPGQAHSSKVSKPLGRKKGPQRRLNISQKVSSDSLPLSSNVDAAEPQPSPPPNRVTLCRSKRIPPPVSSIIKNPTKTASTDPSKRAVRSKPERNVASTQSNNQELYKASGRIEETTLRRLHGGRQGEN